MKFKTARWSIFCVLILTYILVYFHRMAPGVVSEYLMAEFQTTGARLGLLSAIYFFVYAAMQLPAGVLADTLGTRTAIISGNLIAGLGSILFGIAVSFGTACAGRFLVGLGVSVIFVSIMKNNAVWFPARMFGLMSGLTLLIGNLGSVIAAGPLSALLSFFSWRSIFISIGVLSLLLSAAAFLIVRNKPEDLGFASPNPRTAINSGFELHASWLKNLWCVLTTRSIWPSFWVNFGVLGGLYSFMGLWGVPYLRDVQGLSLTAAARYMTVLLLSYAVGNLFFGWVSDRLGRRKPVLVVGISLYTGLWLLHMFSGWSPGTAGLWLFGLMGFTGASFVVTFACAKESLHPDLSGMAVSVVNTGCFIGTSLMQPLFGWIADRTWDGTLQNGIRIYSRTDYHNGFLLMLAFISIGLLAACMTKETR
jgi:sugar phosphate permease